MLSTLICLLPLILALLALLVRKISPPLYARTFAPVLAKVRTLEAQLLAKYQATDGYLKAANLGLVGAVLIFLVLPPVVRIFYPTAGGFDQGTLNTLALAALQYFAAGHLALLTYKRLLPSFYAYLMDTLQDKVLENVTSELETQLAHPETLNADDGPHVLHVLTERRKLLEFKFSIRCKRLLFCSLPLAFFYIVAQLSLTAALTIVPH